MVVWWAVWQMGEAMYHGGGQVLIGADGNGGRLYRLAGDIDEIFAVGGAISASDLANLESYLLGEYGL